MLIYFIFSWFHNIKTTAKTSPPSQHHNPWPMTARAVYWGPFHKPHGSDQLERGRSSEWWPNHEPHPRGSDRGSQERSEMRGGRRKRLNNFRNNNICLLFLCRESLNSSIYRYFYRSLAFIMIFYRNLS